MTVVLPLGALGALRDALDCELPGAVCLRRELHARPSLSGQEEPTLNLLLDALPGGADAERVAGTGAVLRISAPGPAVGVRTELDALPITEATGVPWAARPGAMHACGHDIHMAALVALARALHEVGPPVPMLAILQPREEGPPSGGRDVVSSGLLQDHQLAAMAAAHVQPLLPAGDVACAPGVINASADRFRVTMAGSPGHAAYPHLTHDPVLALANFVVSVQQLVSRNTDPMQPAVVTVGTLAAGEAANAIPGTATAQGTMRAMSEAHRTRLHERLRDVANGIGLAHGCTAKVVIDPGMPVLDNDPSLAALTAEQLTRLGVRVTEPLRTCGADDFSFYNSVAPGLMLFVGTDGQPGSGLHTATFLPSDRAVGDLAHALLACYLAGCATITG
ncbi:M20 family metallopeptidase [Trebonia sp.]|uniref:M20 metallopeptidase family protein n=1 Tax=Trebonia sp. TaxID=2767075 RepID=UPI002604FE98|nr:M20 family metallopeptidase [Trebonia sp.]